MKRIHLFFLVSTAFIELAAANAQEILPVAVVKLSDPMKMDGDASTWASIRAEEPIEGRMGTAGFLKAAYDNENFYALFRVNDPSPLKNGSTIAQEILKGGDALGLCFGTGNPADAQRILFARASGRDIIVALRPQWPQKQPYTFFTTAAGGVQMDFVGSIEAEGASTHFETTPSGYLAEVKIPWKSLGMHPSASFTFSFDAQIIFSDPAGATNVDTAWWHSRGAGPLCTTDLSTEARLYPSAWGVARLFDQDPGPVEKADIENPDPAFIASGVPITFNLPKTCRVSLIIKDKNGWIVRELLRSHTMPAGANTVYWDGRDRWGYLLPPDTYSYLVGYFDGMKASFAGSVGNSANPPYRTSDGLGSAGGMHGGPYALAAAKDGNFMYLLNAGEEGQPAMRKIDIATGKALWFHTVGGFGDGKAVVADDHYVYMISTANKVTTLVRIDPQTGKDFVDGWKSLPVVLGDVNVTGLAISSDKAYYSVATSNRIGTINLTTGEKENDISIPSPLEMCSSGNDTLLVCSEKQVVRLNVKTGNLTPVITGLEAPAAVAVDSEGNIYVSDLGKAQQIKKFSATGQQLASFGVAGGRGHESAPYNPLAYRNVGGLAIGPDGNLWLVERNAVPRRSSVITPNGQFVRDIFGPSRCTDTVGFDTDDFSSIYHSGTENPEGEFLNSIVDYDAYAKSPDPQKGFHVKAVWHLAQNGVEGAKDPVAQISNGEHERCTAFTGTNGKRYLAFLTGRWISLFLWENNRWIASALVGGDGPDSYWADKNGDGTIQPEETAPQKADFFWGAIGKDLTVYSASGSLKPASIDGRGVPTYAGGKYTATLAGIYPTVDNLFDLNTTIYGVNMDRGTSDDSVYICSNNGPSQNMDYWDRASENRLAKIKDGRVQWMVGHHDGTIAHNGDAMMFFGVAGETDGVVLVSDIASNFVGYTTDGLALGWALTDPAGRTPVVGSNAIYIENAAAGVFRKDPKTGKHLLLVHTCEDVRILEITGVFGDDIKRIEGKVTLEKCQPRPIEATINHVTIPALTWEKSIYDFSRGTNVDGADYEWSPKNPCIPISDGKAAVGEIRLRRDAGNLCVFTDVLAPSAFPPTTATDGNALFAQGDGVELLLGPITSSPRTTAALGDTRIFLTATRGADGQLTGRAFACKPASTPVPPSKELSMLDALGVPRDGGTTAPLDFSSGLVPIPGAMIKVRDRFDRQGYVLEAEIPLALMPEISKVASITFLRAAHDSGAGVFTHAMRSDLLPALFNVAIWRNNAKGVSQRYPWRHDDFTGTDPKAMNPSLWGVESDPLSIILGVAAPSDLSGVLHEKTTFTTFNFDSPPTRHIDSAIFGGGWFDEKGLKFLTTPSCAGFDIIPGLGIESVDGGGRVTRTDMTSLGIQNLRSQAQRSAKAGDPVTATIKTKLAPGQTATLHVLWGSFTANTEGGGELSISDSENGQIIDKTSVPELAFDLKFNAGFAVRESTFTIAGNGPFELTLRDTHGSQCAVLSAIWIEPPRQTSFSIGDHISLSAYLGATPSPVQAVEFFSGPEKIGETTAMPYVLDWQPRTSGDYEIRAQVVDNLGDTGISSIAKVHVNPRAPK